MFEISVTPFTKEELQKHKEIMDRIFLSLTEHLYEDVRDDQDPPSKYRYYSIHKKE